MVYYVFANGNKRLLLCFDVIPLVVFLLALLGMTYNRHNFTLAPININKFYNARIGVKNEEKRGPKKTQKEEKDQDLRLIVRD